MQTLEMLKRKIGNAEDVQSVVGAMKVLAIVSIRRFGRSLDSLNDYVRAVELGLQAVLQNLPDDEDEARFDPLALAAASWKPEQAVHTCAVVFGSEQGLSGQFNEHIAAYALGELEKLGIARSDRSLLAVGDHVSFRLRAARQPVEKKFPVDSSVKAMRNTVRSLFFHFDEMRRQDRCGQILLFHHKSLAGAHSIPFTTRLFPLDLRALRELRDREWPSSRRPVFSMDWQRLLASLTQQYIRVILEKTFVESLVSENSSRLMAMQVAEGNIADFLEELQHEFNEERQGQITSEILDIVAGLEAMEKTGYGVNA